MITLMSVIVAFLFAISLWYLSSNHKVTFVKLKATNLKFLPNRSWHRLIPAGGTFVSAKGGTFQSDTPGTFVSAMGGTFDSDIPGTFESATGGTFNPLLSLEHPDERKKKCRDKKEPLDDRHPAKDKTCDRHYESGDSYSVLLGNFLLDDDGLAIVLVGGGGVVDGFHDFIV